MRDAPFNMKRAELCNRDCSKNIEEIQSMQHQAQVTLLKEYADSCMSIKNAKERQTCLESAARRQIDRINSTLI